MVPLVALYGYDVRHLQGTIERAMECCTQTRHLLSAAQGLRGRLASQKAPIGSNAPDYSPMQAIAQPTG